MLTEPTPELHSSFFSYIHELGAEERYPFTLDLDASDFQAYLNTIKGFERGINLPRGSVDNSTRWLIKEGNIVGIVNIRHYLSQPLEYCGGHIGLSIRPSCRGLGYGQELMALAIKWLQVRNVKDIHIHCYKDNPASANTIKACGGRLKSEIKQGRKLVSRYLISTVN